ncbi:MAG: hypothetical protein WCK98_03895 [bacterium]
MSKKNLKNDLLSQFFDHSPNYKTKRSSGYFKFLRLQKQQQLLQIYNQFYMTFIFKPYKLVLANIAIVLVILFSFTSFGFGLITQAENNPGASFTPTDSIDTTRLEGCNLDIAFPKKSAVYSDLSFSAEKNVYTSEVYRLVPMERANFNFNTSSFKAIFKAACFKDISGDSYDELVRRKEYQKSKISSSKIAVDDLKKILNFKILNNPEIKNTQLISALGSDELEHQYLGFEIKNFKYTFKFDKTVERDSKTYDVNDPMENTYETISFIKDTPDLFDFNYNENSNFSVSEKITYDEQGNYSKPYTPNNQSYDQQVETQNYKRMAQFFGILLTIVVLTLLILNYILNKKIKTKITLQTKIRLLLASYGLIYLIFVNTFNAFASQVDFLYQVYNYRLDIAAMLVVAGLSFVLVAFNWKKLSKKVRFIDLAFLFVYILYVISLIFNFSPYYSGDGTADMFGLVWLYIYPAIFTLSWVSYSAWNGYLAGKQIWLTNKQEQK